MGEGKSMKPLFLEEKNVLKVPLPMGEGFRVRVFMI
jgi:hypothetical protein